MPPSDRTRPALAKTFPNVADHVHPVASRRARGPQDVAEIPGRGLELPPADRGDQAQAREPRSDLPTVNVVADRPSDLVVDGLELAPRLRREGLPVAQGRDPGHGRRVGGYRDRPAADNDRAGRRAVGNRVDLDARLLGR